MPDDIQEIQQSRESRTEATPNSFADEAAHMLAAGPLPPLNGEIKTARTGRLSRWRARPIAEYEWTDDPAPAFEAEEHPGRPRRAWPWVVLMVVIVAVAVTAYAIISDRSASAGPQYGTVPKVVGMAEAKAVKKIEAAGFDCRIQGRQPSTEVAEGLVLSQDAEGGTKFEKGSSVGLVISSGTGQVKVPNVVGLTQAEATAKLTEAGLEAVAKPEVAAGGEVGKVLRQNPQADKKVDAGERVTITVAAITNTVKVPPLTGMPQDNAVALLKGMGLVPVVQETKSQLPGGVVDHQDPASATEVQPGATVKIFVSNSPVKKTVFVPAVGGLDLTVSQAKAILAMYGLKAQTIDFETPDYKPGLCIYQDPVAGVEVKIGSYVKLTIARKPADTSTTVPTSPSGVARYDQTDKHIAKSGAWSNYSAGAAYLGSYGRSNTAGASATIYFTGTRLDWIAMKGTTTGVAMVYLDGAKKATINLAAGSPKYFVDVWSSGNLARGSHKVQIVLSSASPAGKYLTLDAVDIWGTIK